MRRIDQSALLVIDSIDGDIHHLTVLRSVFGIGEAFDLDGVQQARIDRRQPDSFAFLYFTKAKHHPDHPGSVLEGPCFYPHATTLLFL